MVYRVIPNQYRERGVLIDAPPNFVTVAERIDVEYIWR